MARWLDGPVRYCADTPKDVSVKTRADGRWADERVLGIAFANTLLTIPLP
jgi:hypothetical protein